MYAPSFGMIVLTLLFAGWVVLIPAFYQLGYDTLARRNPQGLDPRAHHNMAFAIAATWPITYAMALFRRG